MSSLLTKILTAAQVANFGNLINNQSPNTATKTSSTIVNNTLDLQQTIDNLGDRLEEIPFTFINTANNLQSSNVSNDVLIFQGVPVPVGYYGKAQDFNVIFGTVAGTVKIALMDYNAKNIISYYQTGFTTTSNGTAELVIDENQCIALLGQVAGAGTVNVLVTGFIKQKRGLVRHR